MNRKWMPITAGVLDILGGSIQLLFVIWASIYTVFAVHSVEGLFEVDSFFGFTGILAIVGGIYALRKKKWGLALAGSFTAFFPNILWPFLFLDIRIFISFEMLLTPLLFFGIAAIVLTVLSRKEFR